MARSESWMGDFGERQVRDNVLKISLWTYSYSVAKVAVESSCDKSGKAASTVWWLCRPRAMWVNCGTSERAKATSPTWPDIECSYIKYNIH